MGRIGQAMNQPSMSASEVDEVVSLGLETSPRFTYGEGELDDIQQHMVWAGMESLMALQRPMLETLGYDNVSTETLSRYGLALIIEVGEFLNETPWKAWPKTGSKECNIDRMTDEFVDMLSFIGSWLNFLNMMGINPAHISNAYRKKLKENNLRFGVPTEGT